MNNKKLSITSILYCMHDFVCLQILIRAAFVGQMIGNNLIIKSASLSSLVITARPAQLNKCSNCLVQGSIEYGSTSERKPSTSR